MTRNEHAKLMTERAAICDRLDALEAAGRIDDAAALFARNRWINSYDDAGNWVGAVAYENGWAA